MEWQITVGLEIHAELKTKTGMFCNCKNDPNERHPNVNICPVCVGHPGALPVANEEAVRQVQRVGVALGADLQKKSHFDRKHYFYPDIPKGYQISQYKHPLVLGGALKGIKITRIHLEEDSARSQHDNKSKSSLVDFNRSGIPLMELVTEPDIKSAKQAREFAEELQLVFQYLGASEANMEKGEMRCEANVSVRSNAARSNGQRIEANEERIVLKEESYRLMGLLFEVQNKLGSVYKEKNYQDAIEELLKREKIPYEREKRIKLKLDGKEISDFFVDFLIDSKIILEIKATKFITQEDIRQALRYIKEATVPLGIVVNFRREKLEYKRVVNPKFAEDSIEFDINSSGVLGVKVEVKNLNSFRAVERAIEYEAKRQIELLESGGKVKQETRGWDENKETTFSQRSKESAHDYRYFPEPDLPPMEFSDKYIEELSATIPELPEQKRKRLTDEYKLDAKAVEILIRDRSLSAFWEKVASELTEWLASDSAPEISLTLPSPGKTLGVAGILTPSVEEGLGARPRLEISSAESEAFKLASNYFTSDLLGLMKEKQIPSASELLIDPENFAELIKMIVKKEITSRVAKDILRVMVEKGGDPSTWVEKLGLSQIGDESALDAVVKKIIDANPKAVSDFKAGKEKSIQFLVGQVMKETRGAASPDKIKKLLTRLM